MKSIKIAAAATGLIGSVMAGPASAADLTLVASTAMREVLEAAVPAFERETGHVVNLVFLSGTVLPARIKDGVPADLVVTSPETIDDLVRDGKLVAGSRLDFVRSAVGVAVRAGAPKPDVSTVETFKRSLLAARSVGISQGPSGVHMMRLIDQLGIAAAIKAKAVITEPGQRVGLLVADGRAELGVQQISELLAMPGIDYVGPLPAELQPTIVYASARPTNARQPAAAGALARFLTSKAVAPIARKMGLDPL